MPSKPKCSHFFKVNKYPRDWGIIEYLNYDHGKLPPRKVLDGWKKSLDIIIKCTDKEFSQSRRKRAAELLKRFKEKVRLPSLSPFGNVCGDRCALWTY